MAKALSLVCKDCGKQLKSAEEAQTHAEETFHTNFEESSEAILQLVCKTCGKPCRSQTEKDMHTKRNPGHDTFIDKTNEQAAITYSGAAGGASGGQTVGGDTSMEDMDEETKKAIALSMGVEEGTTAELPKERISDKVNKEIMEQLKEMGFPEIRAEKALWLTGNSNLETAITWLADHGEDADIDEPLMVAPAQSGQSSKPKLSPEEQKKLLEEKLAKLRADKERQNKELERQQELARIASSKELTEARRKQKEQEELLAQEKRRREKEQEAKDRARVKAELAKDKAERMAKAGIKPAEAAASPTQTKPEDVYKDRKLTLSSKLRDIIAALRNDPATPNPANKAMETAGKYIENIVKNPTEEKYRAINLENAAFQRLIGTKPGGLPMMHALGFVEADGKLTLGEIDVKWLEVAQNELQTACKRGPFY